MCPQPCRCHIGDIGPRCRVTMAMLFLLRCFRWESKTCKFVGFEGYSTVVHMNWKNFSAISKFSVGWRTFPYHQIQLKPQVVLNFSQEEGAADAILLQDPAGQNLFVVNQVQPELFVMGIPAGMGPLWRSLCKFQWPVNHHPAQLKWYCWWFRNPAFQLKPEDYQFLLQGFAFNRWIDGATTGFRKSSKKIVVTAKPLEMFFEYSIEEVTLKFGQKIRRRVGMMLEDTHY